MSDPEIVWHADKSRDFLSDFKAFCRSLDWYQIEINLVNDTGTQVELEAGGYRLVPQARTRAFGCPECAERTFEVAEGELDGQPALGLLCRACETYGVLFPRGL